MDYQTEGEFHDENNTSIVHDIGKLGELDSFSEVDLVDEESFNHQPASETLKSTKKSRTQRLNRLKNFFSFNAKSKNTKIQTSL